MKKEGYPLLLTLNLTLNLTIIVCTGLTKHRVDRVDV